MSAAIAGGVAPQHSAVDQRHLDEFAKITNEYATDSAAFHQSIKVVLPNNTLPQYYLFIYSLLAIVLHSKTGDVPTLLTQELFWNLKLIKMPHTRPSPGEKRAVSAFTLAAFGILALLGGEGILETFKMSTFIVASIWKQIEDGVDKDGFVRKLLAAHADLVAADSVIWKAGFQVNQGQAQNSRRIREYVEEVMDFQIVLKRPRVQIQTPSATEDDQVMTESSDQVMTEADDEARVEATDQATDQATIEADVRALTGARE